MEEQIPLLGQHLLPTSDHKALFLVGIRSVSDAQQGIGDLLTQLGRNVSRGDASLLLFNTVINDCGIAQLKNFD